MRTPAPVLLLSCLLVAAALIPPTSARGADDEVAEAVRVIKSKAKEPRDQKDRTAALRRLGNIGGAEAAAAVLPLFSDPFVHLRDHAVSAWIRMLKGDRAAETLVWMEKHALKHRRPEVRRGAVIAISRSGVEGGHDALRPRLQRKREKDTLVLVALLEAWGRDRAWRRASVDLVSLLRHKDPVVVLAAADAVLGRDEAGSVPPGLHGDLGAHRDPLGRTAGVLLGFAWGWPSEPEVNRVLADDAVEPRIALAEILSVAASDAAERDAHLGALGALLAADAWRVRAAAIDAAARRREAEVVPLLIARLSREDGRLRLDLADALEALTGKSLGDDPELWTAWWEANRGDFEVPGRRGGKTRPGPAKADDETQAAFFRLPVRSKRIAFLIDCSGSMRDPAFADRPSGPTKTGRARDELAKTLDALPEDTRFDVFFYRYPTVYPPAPVMTRAFKRLQLATAAHRKKALAWLDGEKPYGWGAFYDPLAELISSDEVDTIYFLSDGRPSRGTYDRGFRLIAELERDERFRRTVVHTVLVGTAKADAAFLEDLARVTGGHFVDAAR